MRVRNRASRLNLGEARSGQRFPGLEDTTYAKFLTARNDDADAASEMLGASMRWRRCTGRARAERAAAYWMEKAVAKSPDGKVVVVVVRDLTAPKGGGGLNKLAYPASSPRSSSSTSPSLAKAVIVPADGWFRGLWGVASRFVDAKTRSKIHLLPDHRDLLKHVPYQELLQLGGGSRHRFSLADVEGLPKEWGEYHQRQQQMQQQQQALPPPPPRGPPPPPPPPLAAAAGARARRRATHIW
ncbi:hypothetical protein SO694_00035353 [Aureococcus anophagefferens]|uniref:CRAL-TRIO domain-containing protein n=1 Tax=Aureococcus anophagefferens TaxID=44056 RepID=A0ABR1FKT0_AURAN